MIFIAAAVVVESFLGVRLHLQGTKRTIKRTNDAENKIKGIACFCDASVRAQKRFTLVAIVVVDVVEVRGCCFVCSLGRRVDS